MTKKEFPKVLTPIESKNPFLNSVLNKKRHTVGGGTPSETASFTPKQTSAPKSPQKSKEPKVPGLDLSKVEKNSESIRIGTAVSGVTA